MTRLYPFCLLAGLALLPYPVAAATLSEMESQLDLRRPADQMQSTFVGKEVRLTAWQQMENVKAGKGWGIVREKKIGSGAGWLAKPVHDGAVVARFPHPRERAYVWLKQAGAATYQAYETNGNRLGDAIPTPYATVRAELFDQGIELLPYVVLGTHAAAVGDPADVDIVDARDNRVLLTVPKVKAGTRPLYKHDALAFEHGDTTGGFSLVTTGLVTPEAARGSRSQWYVDKYKAPYALKAVPGRYRALHLGSNVAHAEDMDGHTVVFARDWKPFSPKGERFGAILPLLERQGGDKDKTIYMVEVKEPKGERGWQVLWADAYGQVKLAEAPMLVASYAPEIPGRARLQGPPWRALESQDDILFGRRKDGLWEAWRLKVDPHKPDYLSIKMMRYSGDRSGAVATSPDALKADIQAGKIEIIQ